MRFTFYQNSHVFILLQKSVSVHCHIVTRQIDSKCWSVIILICSFSHNKCSIFVHFIILILHFKTVCFVLGWIVVRSDFHKVQYRGQKGSEWDILAIIVVFCMLDSYFSLWRYVINLASRLNAKENMQLSQSQVWLLLGIMLIKGKTNKNCDFLCFIKLSVSIWYWYSLFSSYIYFFRISKLVLYLYYFTYPLPPTTPLMSPPLLNKVMTTSLIIVYA